MSCPMLTRLKLAIYEQHQVDALVFPFRIDVRRTHQQPASKGERPNVRGVKCGRVRKLSQDTALSDSP